MKKLLSTILLTLMLTSMLTFNVQSIRSGTSDTVVSTKSGEVTVGLGQALTVDLGITDVEDLYGYEIKLWYRNDVLTAIEVVRPSGHFMEPEMDPNNFFIVKWEIKNDFNASHGRIWLAYTLLAPETGKSGSGIFARITFNGTNIGTTSLVLNNYPGTQGPVALARSDGTSITHLGEDSAVTVEWTPESTETVYIRADGSIDPPTAPIITYDNETYTLTDNITSSADGVVVERDNIVIDGAGYTLQGTGGDTGIDLSGRTNVTVQNTQIKNFHYGIWLHSSSYNSISGNNITANHGLGIGLWFSFYNSISDNIANNGAGIWLYESSNNGVSDNIANNSDGIWLFYSSNNSVSGNHITASNWSGINLFLRSNHNSISGNTIANSEYGIWLSGSSHNIVYHNNFIDNTRQVYDYAWDDPEVLPSVNFWDDGYPSGGNYWSDYGGVDEKSGLNQDEAGSDGIGDTPYVIDENNRDRYPLMKPYIVGFPYFELEVSPQTQTVSPGGSATYTVSVKSFNNFDRPVSLTGYAQTGITLTFTPGTVTPPANGVAQSQLAVKADLGLAAGKYVISIQGESAGLVDWGSVEIDVISLTPPALDEIIFTGRVSEIKKDTLSLLVEKVFYGVALRPLDKVDVNYDSALKSVYLADVRVGDLIQVYGKIDAGIVQVYSEEHGLVNLKHLEIMNVKANFASSDKRSIPYEYSKDLSTPVGTIRINIIFEITSQSDLSIGWEGTSYGASRKGSTGMLQLKPHPGKGKQTISVFLRTSVSFQGKSYSQDFSRNFVYPFNIELGKESRVEYARIPIPIFDVPMIASLEIGIAPSISVTPLEFAAWLRSSDQLVFPTTRGHSNDVWLVWSTHNPLITPIIFRGDNSAKIVCDSWATANQVFNIALDATLETLLGKHKYPLGTLPIDQQIGTAILGSNVELSTFNPYYCLTLKSPITGTDFKIDDKLYETDSESEVSTFLKRGRYFIEALNTAQVAEGTRYIFTKWDDGTRNNRLELELDRDTVLVADYRLQHYIAIKSPVPIHGEGWYDHGSSMNISAQSIVPIDHSSRYKFVGWTGDISDTSTTTEINMIKSFQITANYQLQHYLGIKSPIPIQGEGWYDYGSLVNISAQSIVPIDSNSRYKFLSWSGDINDPRTTIEINITKPLQIRAEYAKQYSLHIGESPYNIDVVSNSTISGFYFNSDGAFIRFDVAGTDGTTGLCRVSIPKQLLWAESEWKVLIDDKPTNFTLTQDEDYNHISFSYMHSTKTVVIKGTHAIGRTPTRLELQTVVILALFVLILVIALAFARKKRPKKTET